jgi:hypothetical protein
VVLPALVLWIMATAVSTSLLHPFDVREYERYAHGALQAPLFHRLPLEYPAPALVLFILPLALPFSYPWAFAVLVGVALVVLVTSYEGAGLPGWDTRAAGRLIIYLAVGAVMLLAGRYDVIATLAAFLAVRSAGRDRWSSAWTWSSIGFVVKLFPAVFWPVFLIAEWRQHGRIPLRRLWWVAGSILVLAGVPALLNHAAALNALRYYLHRPTEDGSLGAGLSVLLDWHSANWILSFHSVNVVSGITANLSTAIEIAGVAACLWVWWAQARGRLPMQAACLATLTFVMLGSKVLSAQYIIWLMPLWALYRLRATWLLAAAANLIVFPYVVSAEGFGYLPAHPFAVGLTLTFFARDVFIAVGTVVWLRSVLGDQALKDDPARGSELVPQARAIKLT